MADCSNAFNVLPITLQLLLQQFTQLSKCQSSSHSKALEVISLSKFYFVILILELWILF